MLNCLGHSTVKYLLNTFTELKEYLEPMAKINENAIIYPCFLQIRANNMPHHYVIRFMGKGQSPIIPITNDKQTEYFHAVTYKQYADGFDVNSLYEHKDEE